jgi:dienelactone hydrolase
MYGLDDFTKNVAERLVPQGFDVATPDLFADAPAKADATKTDAAKETDADKESESPADFIDYADALSDAKIVESIIAALDKVTAHAGVSGSPIGVIGWGWSGAYALMAASHDARFSVVADIGGVITYPVQTAQRPGSPLNFLANIEGAFFAAFPGADPTFPDNEIQRLRGQMINHDKRGEVKVYQDAPARFWRDEELPQTQQLWRRLEGFLREHMLEDVSPEEIDDEGAYPNEESRLHA